MAKIRKKLVKSNGFWRINANRFFSTLAKARIRPKTKIKLKRTRKYENESNAKLEGLVKELGFLFVTLKLFRGRGTTSLLSDEFAQPWCAAPPIVASIRMGGIRLPQLWHSLQAGGISFYPLLWNVQALSDFVTNPFTYDLYICAQLLRSDLKKGTFSTYSA